MTEKIHILLIIFIIGFFSTPTLTYACGTKTDKTERFCCKKNKSGKIERKDCCKNHKSKNSKNKDGCGGKCNHPSCRYLGVHFAFNLHFPTELKTKTCFSKSKKVKFYFQEAYCSSGFLYVWLPPKIG